MDNRELAAALTAADGIEAERKAIKAERLAILKEREAKDAALAKDAAKMVKQTVEKLLDDPAALKTRQSGA